MGKKFPNRKKKKKSSTKKKKSFFETKASIAYKRQLRQHK